MTEQAARSDHVAAIDRLMREITWHAHKQSMHMLTQPDIDLTLPQMITLFAIHEQGICRMSELADRTQQSAGTLTGIVDRLIDEGLVSRVRNATDRRVVEVTLTPKGEERLEYVLHARREDFGRMLQSFSDDDLLTCERILQQLLERFRDHSTYQEEFS